MQKYTFSDRLILVFCRVEPAGLSPRAPGTMGALLAALLAPVIFLPLSLPLRLTVLVLLFIAGGFAATRAERLLGEKDPGSLVIDELFGQWVALLPFAAPAWWEIALAFGIFRFFDIAKPWPVKASETWLPDGFGVMIDDFCAGLYTLLVMLFLKCFVFTRLFQV